MQHRRLTGLAAKSIEFRDKVAGTTDHINALKAQLEAGGEDYADAADQCDKINKALEGLSDLFVDLSVLVLKADKVRAASQDEARPDAEDRAAEKRYDLEENGSLSRETPLPDQAALVRRQRDQGKK